MATKSATTAPAKVETITLRHLAESLSGSHELPKKQVLGILDDMVGSITKHLKKGVRVRISGLGILQVRKRPARTGRNQDQGQQEGRLPPGQGAQGSGLTAGSLHTRLKDDARAAC